MTRTATQQADGGDPAVPDTAPAETGRRYWRSLEQLADTDEFREFLHREFPRQASEWSDEASRRQFLRLMGASIALAGVGGCAFQPPETIVPYVRQPEDLVPGRPLFFATSMTLGGYAVGLLAESHEGRPTKLEGNDRHPASLGAIDAISQASILGLYDPDRSQVVTRSGRIGTWDAFLASLGGELEALRARQGAGLRLLTETVGSPCLADRIARLKEAFPEARWHQYEPSAPDAARAGARLAFGRDVEPVYRFDKADVLLTLDADPLCAGPGSLAHARQFASRREVRDGQDGMNRLYAVESTPTGTGAVADHRVSVRARDVEELARAIAARLQVPGAEAPGALPEGVDARWVEAVAADLEQARGKGLVVAGSGQPPAVHALAHALNQTLGNVGQAVVFVDPIVADPADQGASLVELARDMKAGQVTTLVILGGNPAYTAPADLEFAEALDKVALRIHLSAYQDETSARCHWHIPEAHALETWGDGRAHDGTITLEQPLIAPLYGGKSALELVQSMLGETEPVGFDILRNYWKERGLPGANFEKAWRAALHEGLVVGSAAEPVEVEAKPAPAAAAKAESGGLEILFRPDPTVHDGRFANNGWLQELPKPLTKLTWDNAALLSPKTADELGLADEDLIELTYRGRTVQAPVWRMPNHADGSVTVHLGYGRTRAGRVGDGIGFNAYALRTSDAPDFGAGLEVRKAGGTLRLATTQSHRSLEGRPLLQAGTLEQFRRDPHSVVEEAHEPPAEHTLYPAYEYKDYAWGMAINLGACTGCNACVVACQAENNIPVVGKEQVAIGREMHWLEIDTYFEGDDPNRPDATHFQPRLCMHCEDAPCEVVCPVAATVHDAEGINNMIYNRCVGTRYCSNNCPYKVRHFNFLQYADTTTPVLKLLNNPDVTVRARGVMEKCTYCIQRISEARIDAERKGEKVRDGEILTACQAACPTRAIVFGDINDRQSEVAARKASPLNFSMLGELNTRPRTTYLAKLTNPNPALVESPEEPADGSQAS